MNPAQARELEQLAAARTSPKAKKALRAWIGEGFRPALCYASPGAPCPLRGVPCGGDVKLLTIIAQGGPSGRGRSGRGPFGEQGYNIREVSLTGRAAPNFYAPVQLSLPHVLTAAALILPFTLSDWYPLELEERWAARHASALAEFRTDGPLTEPDPARRRELHERVVAKLKPARPWFLLKELIEPGDVVFPVGGHGPARRSTCCVQEVV